MSCSRTQHSGEPNVIPGVGVNQVLFHNIVTINCDRAVVVICLV